MPARALSPAPKTYAQLRDAVVVVVADRRAIDRAWLDTYHETGRLINEHVLLFKERANYGARIYEKLAADTSISARISASAPNSTAALRSGMAMPN